jgi:bifunctional UDP-N-acetylglucosamine pyrophosphorylase / glucosamine-1-phosphate N-acetyltransferase
MNGHAIILAAGLGTRMKSSLPKCLHPIGGRPMILHLMENVARVFARVTVVVGPGMERVVEAVAPHPCVVQHDRLGTAHAALQAEAAFGEADVAILYADNPLITEATLRDLRARRTRGDAAMALLAMRPPEPGKYGRVVVLDGYVDRIVEAAEASEAERAIGLCNAGVMCAPGTDFLRWLGRVRNANSKGEYYLTDVVALANAEGAKVAAVEAPFDELRGVNSRVELAAAEAVLQTALRHAAMEGGVTLTAPDTVFLSADTVLAEDVTVGPNVVFGPGVRVETGVEIRAFSHLEGCVVKSGAIIGPFARLRPGTMVGEGAHVGNFVELKATTLGAGAKASHLSYLGDAEIGEGSNIGAGTITCNYDGVHKHRTKIGARAFIGSDAVLVAPVAVGDGAFVAAGSVITTDVPPDALSFGRARQVDLPGRAAAMRKSKG